MKSQLLIFSLFFFYHQSNAQNPLWVKAVPNDSGNVMEGSDIAIDQFGNSYILGFMSTFGESILAKYDSSGNFLWSKNIVTYGYQSYSSSLSTDPSGSVYFTGTFNGSCAIVDGDTLKQLFSNGTPNLYVFKLNANGNVIYGKNWGECIAPYISFPTASDANGDLYLFGSFYSDKIIFGSDTLFNSGTSTSVPLIQLFLVKFDSLGNEIWAKTFYGDQNDYQAAMTIDPTGNILIAGSFEPGKLVFGNDTLTNTNTLGIFLAKFDDAGNQIWGKLAGGTNTTVMAADFRFLVNGMCADANDNLYLIGAFAEGLKLGSDVFYAPVNSSMDNYDGYYAKFSTSGDFAWAKSFGGSGIDFGWDVAWDPNNNNVIITGGFTSASFNIDDNSFVIPDVNDQDASFFAEVNSDGNVVCRSAFNGGGDDWVSVVVDNSGFIYWGGDFLANPFVVGQNVLHPIGGEQLFISKFSPCPGTINQVKNYINSNNVELFPNPALDEFTVKYDGADDKNGKLLLYNYTGQLVGSFSLSNNNSTVSISYLPSGIYFGKISLNNQIIMKKIVVE